jgi:hypothetical protein
MATERPQLPQEQQQQQRDKQALAPKQEKGNRSGEGSRSVLPHLKADQRARAADRVGKSDARDF